MLAFLLALAVLIGAAARPQRSVAVPVTNGAIMIAQDVSSSMKATDVAPSRLGAAQRAAEQFLATIPSGVQVGVVEFAETPIVLQSPTTDHALTRAALGQLHTSGGTAIGDAILTSLREIRNVPLIDGKHPPGAIVLISDGASNVGVDPDRRGPRGGIAAHPDLHGRARYVPGHDPHHEGRHDGHRARAAEPAGARADRKRLRREGVHRR